MGATFGVLLISGATQVHRRVRTRLDRAFFRSSYDAQQILENLAAKTLNVSSREGLAALLQQSTFKMRCIRAAMYRVPRGRRWTVAGLRGKSAGGSDDPLHQRRRDCRTGRPQRAAGTDPGSHAWNAIGAAATGVPGADSRLQRRPVARSGRARSAALRRAVLH